MDLEIKVNFVGNSAQLASIIEQGTPRSPIGGGGGRGGGGRRGGGGGGGVPGGGGGGAGDVEQAIIDRNARRAFNSQVLAGAESIANVSPETLTRLAQRRASRAAKEARDEKARDLKQAESDENKYISKAEQRMISVDDLNERERKSTGKGISVIEVA